jgi:molybdate transport system ATP-binding protein
MSALKANIDWQVADVGGKADFELPNGISALIGKSGAGKTTLAKLLCGLITPTIGHLALGDTILYHSAEKTNMRPQERRIAYIPQEESLFPHMTVKENIEFAIQEKITDSNLIQKLGLEALLACKPHTLSGGEKRRVAIARALLTNPKLIIMDEPTNGLDAFARHRFLDLIKSLHAETGTPMLLISHQIDDIFSVADHLLLMDNQTVIADGALEALSTHPLAIELMGHDNIASLLIGERISSADGIDDINISGQHLYAPSQGGAKDGKVHLRIRSNDVALSVGRLPQTSIQNQLSCTTTGLIDLGTMTLVRLRLKDSDQYILAAITKKSAKDLDLKLEQSLTALVKAVAVRENSRI